MKCFHTNRPIDVIGSRNWMSRTSPASSTCIVARWCYSPSGLTAAATQAVTLFTTTIHFFFYNISCMCQHTQCWPVALSVKQLAREPDSAVTYQYSSFNLAGSGHLGQLWQGSLRVKHFVQQKEGDADNLLCTLFYPCDEGLSLSISLAEDLMRSRAAGKSRFKYKWQKWILWLRYKMLIFRLLGDARAEAPYAAI